MRESRERPGPSSPSAAELIARLTATFPATAPPKKPIDTINGPDVRELEAFLRGRSWPMLTPRDLWPHRAELSLLSTAGFAYYLAAFVLAALTAPDEQRGDFIDHVMLALTPRNFGGEPKYRDRTDGLNASQRELIRDFIRLMRAEHGAAWACARQGNGWEA